MIKSVINPQVSDTVLAAILRQMSEHVMYPARVKGWQYNDEHKGEFTYNGFTDIEIGYPLKMRLITSELVWMKDATNVAYRITDEGRQWLRNYAKSLH